jgi:squalene-hopene/tetraprenyl-beta-curcumene cyclase
MFTRNEMKRISSGREAVKKQLLKALQPDGKFCGRLSSSAVSTAVASLALSVKQTDAFRHRMATDWLCNNQNKDGGWGDTIASPSNLTAVMLSRAALVNSQREDKQVNQALQKSTEWLHRRFNSLNDTELIEEILKFYKNDLTFSVPILSVCILSNLFKEQKNLWQQIPALPFELALLPTGFLNLLKLPVVSYAIPALIAVGIAQATHNQPCCPVQAWLRRKAARPALRKLCRLVPASGGFLEAAPLTGFVAFCLSKSGYADHYIVKKGLHFLRSTMRPDGSWPIDTNLDTWLTSLSGQALYKAEDLSKEEKMRLVNYLKRSQSKHINIFTNAQPGGWSWTDMSGGVPDADDTSGALAALALLEDGPAGSHIKNGLTWLLDLMNNDGGIPTFCKGWGYLPFDRSCCDISAHSLKAFCLWQPRVQNKLQSKIARAISRLLTFLQKAQDKDGAFSPLWFGDQQDAKQQNRVYGTSVVLEALAGLNDVRAQKMRNPAIKFLYACQNENGGFGGEAGCSSKIETTARAIKALAANREQSPALYSAVLYLIAEVEKSGGKPNASPIGMYFSSLWYDEALYPLIFATDALSEVVNSYMSEVKNVA